MCFLTLRRPINHYFQLQEWAQDQIYPKTSLSKPNQILPNIRESVGTFVLGDVAASPRLSRTMAYGNDTVDFRGRPPTPQDSEIDREEATMDLQAAS